MKRSRIKKYWDDTHTESMYDKNLMQIETQAILEHLDRNDTVIDIGCGEGEGTVLYFDKVKQILALDYSNSRLDKLLSKKACIPTIQMDMKDISADKLRKRFSAAITQRSLINLESFREQKETIKRIHSILKDNGKYLMLEGFLDGSHNINQMRAAFNLPPIQIKWHNHFFDRDKLLRFMERYFILEYSRDFSIYFFLTRVFNAILTYPGIPDWDSAFNKMAKDFQIRYGSLCNKNLSRLELLVFRKRKLTE